MTVYGHVPEILRVCVCVCVCVGAGGGGVRVN